MSTSTQIMIVTALIRPNMESRVVEALHELADFPGFFISEVRGQGRGRGAGGSFQTTDSDLTYHRFLQIQMACPSDVADRVCDLIANAAWTGRKGDGVIFTTAAGSFRRIRETRTAGAPR